MALSVLVLQDVMKADSFDAFKLTWNRIVQSLDLSEDYRLPTSDRPEVELCMAKLLVRTHGARLLYALMKYKARVTSRDVSTGAGPSRSLTKKLNRDHGRQASSRGPIVQVVGPAPPLHDMSSHLGHVQHRQVAPCGGFPLQEDGWEWYQEGRTATHRLVQLDSGVLRATNCLYLCDSEDQMCRSCLLLWLMPNPVRRGGKTQGSIRGVVYDAIVNRAARRRRGSVRMSDFRASRRVVRKADKAALEKEIRANTAKVAQFSPELIALMESLQKNLDKGHMTTEFIEQQKIDLNNQCRSGRAVHGRRFPPEEAATAVAAGLVMDMKQLTSASAMLQANHLAAFPSKRSINRLVAKYGKACQGMQGARFLAHLSTVINRPKSRLHASNDEVSVNQLIGYVTTDDGYEVVGLANRCVREKNPEGVQYLLLGQHGIEVRTTTTIDGSQVVTSERQPFSYLQEIAAKSPATLMCLWIIFEPVRRQSNLIVAAIPTRGDLTMSDDAIVFHDIIKSAWGQGHAVNYYGADNASPHAALCRGIQRGLVRAEVTYILKKVSELMPTSKPKPGHSAATPSTQSVELNVDAGGAERHEAMALTLVPILHRPVSVVQLLLKRLLDFDGSLQSRQQHILSDQWLIPYPGLPYAAQRCIITGGFMGVSCEYRHDTRLMVRCQSLSSVVNFDIGSVAADHTLGRHFMARMCRPSTLAANSTSFSSSALVRRLAQFC